jgi:transposase-like protein
MAELAYRQVYTMNPFEARKRLVQTYQQTGSVRKTAGIWHTSRQVVRKWVRRFEAEGEAGLRLGLEDPSFSVCPQESSRSSLGRMAELPCPRAGSSLSRRTADLLRP